MKRKYECGHVDDEGPIPIYLATVEIDPSSSRYNSVDLTCLGPCSRCAAVGVQIVDVLGERRAVIDVASEPIDADPGGIHGALEASTPAR